MTGTQKTWVWTTLQRMAELATRKAEAEQEVERLANAYTAERVRVLEAVPDWSEQEIETTVNAIHLIGTPPVPDMPEPREPTDSPAAGDPLEIPAFLRRGEGAGEEAPAKLVHDADAAARDSAP